MSSSYNASCGNSAMRRRAFLASNATCAFSTKSSSVELSQHNSQAFETSCFSSPLHHDLTNFSNTAASTADDAIASFPIQQKLWKHNDIVSSTCWSSEPQQWRPKLNSKVPQVFRNNNNNNNNNDNSFLQHKISELGQSCSKRQFCKELPYLPEMNPEAERKINSLLLSLQSKSESKGKSENKSSELKVKFSYL